MLTIMEIIEAQKDVRTTYMGGFAGQLVSSGVWFASAASFTWCSFRTAILVLVVGGIFIFPLTQLLLRLMGRPSSLPRRHPMNGLGSFDLSHSFSCYPHRLANFFQCVFINAL